MPVVAGIFVIAAVIEAPPDNDFSTLLGRITMGLTVSPLLICPVLFAWWLLTGRWRRTVGWLCRALLLSLLMACAGLMRVRAILLCFPKRATTGRLGTRSCCLECMRPSGWR